MRFIFKTKYRQDVDLFKHNGQRFWYSLLVIAALVAPLSLDNFYVGELALVLIYAVAGIGLRSRFSAGSAMLARNGLAG